MNATMLIHLNQPPAWFQTLFMLIFWLALPSYIVYGFIQAWREHRNRVRPVKYEGTKYRIEALGTKFRISRFKDGKYVDSRILDKDGSIIDADYEEIKISKSG